MSETKHIEVRAVNVKSVANVDPAFHKVQAVAVLTPKGDGGPHKIYLSKETPEKSNHGRQLVLNHELCHVKFADTGVQVGRVKEELYCDMEALAATADRHLRVNERYLKEHLCGGMSWRKKTQRYAIVSRICEFLEIDLSKEGREKLARYQQRPIKPVGTLSEEGRG